MDKIALKLQERLVQTCIDFIHYVLMLHESNFKSWQDAYEQAAYDLLMELTKQNDD